MRGLWSRRAGVKTKCVKLCFFRQRKWQHNQCSVGFTKCFLCEYHFSGGVILVYLVNTPITLFLSIIALFLVISALGYSLPVKLTHFEEKAFHAFNFTITHFEGHFEKEKTRLFNVTVN